MDENKPSVFTRVGRQVRAVKGRIGSSHGVMVLTYLVGLVLLIAVAASLISITNHGEPGRADGTRDTPSSGTEESGKSKDESSSAESTTKESGATSRGSGDGSAEPTTEDLGTTQAAPDGDPPGMVHNTDVKYLGDNEYRVKWTYADDDGGLPITGHIVRDGNDGVLAEVDGDTYQVVVTYENLDAITVCAVNAAGEGPQAAAQP